MPNDTASAADGLSGPSAVGRTESSTILPSALMDIQPPSEVTSNAATLRVYLNPDGVKTTLRFEYGTTSAYGTTTTTTDAGAGTTFELDSAHISGLQPNTTYHFRAVASNAAGTANSPDSGFTTQPVSCPNAAYRTGFSAALPDCRAYEKVSPIDKNGFLIALPVVAPAGDRVLFRSLGTFAGNPTSGGDYLAERGSTGWSTAGIDPPPSLGAQSVNNFQLWSADLSTFATGLITPAISQSELPLATSGAIFFRNPEGSFTQATPLLRAIDGTPLHELELQLRGASADLSHLDLLANDALIPSDPLPRGDNRLYEVVGSHTPTPTLRLVSVDSSGNALIPCQANAVSLGGPPENGKVADAVSQDGETIFFTAWASSLPGGCGEVGKPVYQLLARVNGKTTVNVSEPQPNAECTTSRCQSAPLATATFRDASADGSRVFFTSTQQLTNNATEGSVNLYEYDFNRPSGHNLVAVSAGDVSGIGPGVIGVLGASADGSRVYFVAGGVLTTQPNVFGQNAQLEAPNLYVYDTESKSTTFVADLKASDLPSLTEYGSALDLTPNGRYLVFTSSAQLTPDDSNQAADVYEYDAQTRSIVRVSTGHDGQDENGNGGGQDAKVEIDRAEGTHAVSEDGQTIVFSTARPLQGAALSGVVNVYEWHQGEVTLLSAEPSPYETRTTTSISPSGRDIVFNTPQDLVPQDSDGLYDIYDARIGGGFPEPPPPPIPCSGEACQGTATAPPPLAQAASINFSGPGNVVGGITSPRPSFLTKRVRGSVFFVTVKVPGGGLMALTGAGIIPVRHFLPHAGTFRLRVRLSMRARSLVSHRRRLRLRLRASYAPTGGRMSTITVALMVVRR